MEKKMVFALVAVMVSAVVAASACAGGAAPSPTAAAVATQVAPTVQAAATQVAPTVQAAATQVAPTVQAAATKAVGTATAAAAASPAASPGASPTAAGNVTAGQAVFQQNCNACHPNGNAGVGPQLRGKNLSAQRIMTQVRNGGGGMPAFSTSQISDQQLADLVAYVQSLK